MACDRIRGNSLKQPFRSRDLMIASSVLLIPESDRNGDILGSCETISKQPQPIGKIGRERNPPRGSAAPLTPALNRLARDPGRVVLRRAD
jgi:hypothetical protein